MNIKRSSVVAILSALLALNAQSSERLEPPAGCYFGFTMGSGEPIADLSSRLEFTPSVFVNFFDFSGSAASFQSMRTFLDRVTAVQGIAMLTLEPWSGLEAVTEDHCRQLAELCAYFELRGIGGIFIRFAHEMNGNWYPWGQRPSLHKAKFRLLAQTVRSRTQRTAMVWAPNYGIGYPFGATVPGAQSADFLALDTNHDGQISDRDDMYEPYYPGNDVVDWVGMTLYHWGISFPWMENELPPANSFAGSLTGVYQGSIPNFYARYCLDPTRNKPMAITETAAFYNTQRGGPNELQIKQAWWKQVFAGAAQFQKIKCINWFDEFKRESIANNNLIDWRVSKDSDIRNAFISDLRGSSHFLDAEYTQQLAPYSIRPIDLPQILPVEGVVAVSLKVRATTRCDLVVDILDQDFQWQGGTRVSVDASTQIATASFRLNSALTDRTSYRWSIFLTPPGGNYLSALAWYYGPHPSADPDSDGADNEQEVVAGTSPRDPLDVLSLGIDLNRPRPVITWNSKVGCRYHLFTSIDMRSWTPASEFITGTGERISIAPPPTAPSRAFYRLEVVRP